MTVGLLATSSPIDGDALDTFLAAVPASWGSSGRTCAEVVPAWQIRPNRREPRQARRFDDEKELKRLIGLEVDRYRERLRFSTLPENGGVKRSLRTIR